MCEIRKLRASGAPGVRYTAEWLGEDLDGTWLLIPPMTAHIDDVGGWLVALQLNPVLALVPDRGRWVASTSHTGAKVDLCRRVEATAHRVEFEDVELDVVWRWGEPARIDDVDEFEALCLRSDEAVSFTDDAEAIRAAVDAGEHPFGPAFRARLIELAGPPDALLAGVWAEGVGDRLVGDMTQLLGFETAARWLDRQRAGEGWLLCGGRDTSVAVVWVDAAGRAQPVLTAPTPEANALSVRLRDAAPELCAFPPPPLDRRGG